VFPTEGEVDVLGAPVTTSSRASGTLARVGAIIEEPTAWSYLSGRKNLEYFARAGRPADDVRRRLGRIDEVLGLVGLEQAAGKKVKAYSQGMRQRLGIAMALLGRPELLVLDEPTNGLDPRGMREIRNLLRRLADEGATVFVSSHMLGEVETMCDRVGVLAGGRLVAEGPPSRLRPTAERMRVEVDDPARARVILGALAGVSLDGSGGANGRVLLVELAPPATAAAINRALVSGGVEVSELSAERESLEDVFVSLVEGADVPR
jgi:ABC-2 type transport system ATP-binding protein